MPAAVRHWLPVSLCWGLIASTALATPPTERPVELPEWLTLGAEYRVETLYIDPLDLNGTEVTEAFWTEQRMLLDLGLRYPDIGGIISSFELLNGGLFGDNGEYGNDPSPNSGLAIASKRPNNAGWQVGLLPEADPLNPDSYAPTLTPIDPIQIRHLYGEAFLPVGLVRVGRMPMAEGAAIAAHDGGRHNRWGVSRYPDVADRVLFATKIDEAIKMAIEGKHHKLDKSIDRGVVFALTYDWNVQDAITNLDDDAYQINTLLSWRQDRAHWFGSAWRDFNLTGTLVYKGNEAFGTSVWAIPTRFHTLVDALTIDLQFSLVMGETREVSEGLAVLSGREASLQDIFQYGAHAFFEYRIGPVSIALEGDFATGDADPRSNNTLTQFSFARDFNVGLLLFEHVLAFQTARVAAVGIENLAQLDATSFPVTEIASEGRFSNAIAAFPQIKVDWVEGPRHWLHTRLGVLAAWAHEPVVDPIQTTLVEDGLEIADDAVNYHGGAPERYYGTEIDLQLSWSYRGFFNWIIEGAALIPGPALHDENGLAVPSFLVENRFLFVF